MLYGTNGFLDQSVCNHNFSNDFRQASCSLKISGPEFDSRSG